MTFIGSTGFTKPAPLGIRVICLYRMLCKIFILTFLPYYYFVVVVVVVFVIVIVVVVTESKHSLFMSKAFCVNQISVHERSKFISQPIEYRSILSRLAKKRNDHIIQQKPLYNCLHHKPIVCLICIQL